MPTYEYRCPKGHDFEHFVTRMSEAQSAMRCPECGETAERRISAGAGLLFKGSGFYITDYGKDGKKDERAKTAAASKASDSASSGEGGAVKASDAKGESKPDSKAEAKPAAKSESKPAASPPGSSGTSKSDS